MRKILIATLSVIGLMIVIGLLAPSEPEPEAASATATEAPTPTPEPTETATPTPTPEPPSDKDGDGVPDDKDFRPKNPDIQTEEQWDSDGDGVPNTRDYDPDDPSVQKAPQPVSYSGSGATVLEIEKPEGHESVGVATFTHQGGSNFSVWSLDQNLEQNDLLVNEIGAYTGTVLFDIREGENSSAFEIGADGPWTVDLVPLSSVRTFDKKAEGTGDDVLLYMGDGGIADLRNDGDSNFAIWKYGNDADLLVNEIGPYSGQAVVRGSGVLAISATGPWSINVK